MNNTSVSGGIGLSGLLTAIFVAAKVFGIGPVASWSWVWVLCPLWISFAIWAAILLIVFVGSLIFVVSTDIRVKNRRKKFEQLHRRR